ncbi:MAG: hypothetical protein GY906_23485 [bacterium]|nr:hypothetical protein [bacterium]
MARTSKTKIGGDSAARGKAMRDAASSGAAAVAQAQSQLLQQRQQGFQREQAAYKNAQIHDQGQEQKRQFNVQAEQQKERTDLEAAKAGFERKSEGGAGGDRAAKLQAEMDRGAGQTGGQIGPLEKEDQERLAEQGKKPMELDSEGGAWQPTKERKQQQAAEGRRQDFRADTERMRAMAYRDQVGVSAQKALAAGDKEAYKSMAKQLAQLPNDTQKRFDRLVKGDTQPNDWSELSKAAKGSEEIDPTLMADIKAKQFSPRVAAFVRSQVAVESLKSIVLSKGSTQDLDIDWTNPKMVAFGEQRQQLSAYMAANPVMQQVSFIRSTEDKMRFLNVLAASQVLLGNDQAPQGPGMIPSTEAMPEAGAPGAPPPLVEQTEGTARPGAPGAGAEAITAARAGGASPQESLGAGQAAQPTAGQKDRMNYMDTPHGTL